MKVLIIAETVDERSGWGRYASSVITETRKKGIECVVISAPELLSFSLSNAVHNILCIRKKITKDITHIHAFDCWPLAVYGTFAAIGKGVPVFITGVGTYSMPPLNSSLKSQLMKWAYARAREIFCISRYTLSRIEDRIGDGNLSVVHWGTTALPRLSGSESSQYRDRFTIPNECFPVILSVGQIKHRKGQLDTLKAVHILKKKYPDILYIAIGSTSDGTYVKKMHEFAKANDMKNNLKIVDTCNDDKGLTFFYSQSSLFAMNSNNEGDHFEGFGLVFLEAAQFGKPAVGSSGCGIEDAIEDGKTGLLTIQGDAPNIARKINMVLANREVFGKAALERAKAFTWERTVEKHIASYKKYEF